MNEARRFVRFLLPGLVTLGQLVLVMMIARQGDALAPWVERLQGSKEHPNSQVATLLVAFVGTGVIGYVLSSAYFTLYWLPPLGWLSSNLSVAAREVVRVRRHIRIPPAIPRCEERLFRFAWKRDAWLLLTEWWYVRSAGCTTNDQFKAIDSKAEHLMDHAHAAGTCFVGTMAGLAVWLNVTDGRSTAGWVVWLVLSIVHVANWWQTLHFHRGLVSDIATRSESKLE